MNIPSNVARHFKSGLIVQDPGMTVAVAQSRSKFATEQLAKAAAHTDQGDYEAATMWAESAVMIAFEAYLMYNRLKLTTNERSHAAMTDIVSWPTTRAGDLLKFGRFMTW